MVLSGRATAQTKSHNLNPDPGHDKLGASCLGDSSALQDYLHLQGRGWARKGAIQSAERPQSRGNTNGGSTSAGMASIT